jgi:hypothetical protein
MSEVLAWLGAAAPVCFVIGLWVAAAVVGFDSRDGRDW